MPAKARMYIAAILALGVIFTIDGLSAWRSQNPIRFVFYLSLAALASALKVRLPNISGTFSLAFLFILIGTTELSLGETIAMGCAGAAIQSWWRAEHKPKPVQLAFNIANIAISSSLAYLAANLAFWRSLDGELAVRVTLAACVFFLTNTILISGVLALMDSQPVRKVWEHWFLWSFPYYLLGASLAGLMILSSRLANWQVSLAVLPLAYLAYTYFRLYVEQHT